MNNLLVTGGAGFIGSNFVKYVLQNYENLKIINLDKLTYAGNLKNLIDIQNNPSYKFYLGDICNEELVDYIFRKENIDTVVNFAAESHVDRSIISSAAFESTNINGTRTLLDVAKNYQIERFLQVSTDEVYGSLGIDGKFSETTPLSPNSPYSASKAGADLMVRAYYHTHNMPVLITRCSNNYGPYQFPEKLIPLMIINALNNKSLPVYGDGMNVRDWIYVEDHCEGIFRVLKDGKLGEVYNLGGNSEKPNIEIVKILLRILDKPETLINYVKDRPGHDRRYAIDFSKAEQELNWLPRYKFEDSLEKTVNWYLNNNDWWKEIISGEYKNYYQQWYKER